MRKLRNDGLITNEEYVGKTREEATQYAIEGNFYVRIIEVDGVTHTFENTATSGNTLLFKISEGIVTNVEISQ
jgi:hypothetical protein